MTLELLAENKLLRKKVEKYEKAIEDIKIEIEKEIINGDSIDYINGLGMAIMIINEKHIEEE